MTAIIYVILTIVNITLPAIAGYKVAEKKFKKVKTEININATWMRRKNLSEHLDILDGVIKKLENEHDITHVRIDI